MRISLRNPQISLLSKFAGLLMKVTATLAKNLLTLLATMTSASAIDGAI